MKKKISKPTNGNSIVKGIQMIHSQVSDVMGGVVQQIEGIGISLEGGDAAIALINQAKDQTGNLMTELMNGAAALGTDAQHQFESIMRILNIKGMIDAFGSLIKGIVEGTVKLFLKFLQEIKKIIRILWELVFGNMPKWFEMVLLLIDELVKHAVEALFPKLAAELSASEVMYLTEIRAARYITLLDNPITVSDDK
ncbi:MAG: hypothetical protein AABY47_04755 [Pseudomonadota bacterium]